MKFAGPGSGTSGVEVANLTPDGFELWLGNEKLLVSRVLGGG